jgi:sterol desaturase/sphingolipid hydroxylase (fatty acid hydroxylase superfamily)
MTLKRLIVLYVTYPAVIVYVVLAAASVAAAAHAGAGSQPVRTALAIGAASLAYPVVWYLLHRFLLHSRRLYKNRLTARLWKRIHYDHHQTPHRMDVLFGSLTNTLPTIGAATLLIGWVIGGASAAFAALGAGLLTTCFYEFCHCVQHLNIAPRGAWLKEIKRLHMAHHFHDETGNFGIVAFWPDRLLGTHYAEPAARPRSLTTFNLGYDEAEAVRYPWVAQLSAGGATDLGDDRVRGLSS